jgi:oligopeptidase B
MTIAPSPLSPPAAPREAKDVTVHGDRRCDDYFWLRDKDDPRTLPYLKAENAYADAWFAPHAALKEKLYQEMFGRIKQDDDSVPYRKGAWWYSSRTLTGDQYPRYIRRRAIGADRAWDPDGSDETLLELNEMARGHAFLRLGEFAVTPDAASLAYSLDLTGGRDYTLHIRDLVTGRDDAWSMPQVSSAEWAADSRTLYYVTMDETKRASKLWRHVRGDTGPDTLVLEEEDELFDLGIGKTRDDRYLVLTSESKDSSEQRVLDAAATADASSFRVVFPRRADVEYYLDHRAGSFWVLVNDTGRNFRLVKVEAARPDLARAEEVIPARDRVMLDDVDVFAEHVVVTERVDGNLQLRVLDLVRGGEHVVAFDEPAYTVEATGNAEAATRTLRFVYTSMTTPASTFDYDLGSRERVLRKRQPVPGYDPSLYVSERLMAQAGDGTEVPISLVWRRDRKRAGPQPLLLYGYGSYGLPTDPWFSQTRVSLLDRGVIFAIAHIRGGGDLGRTWYDAGKMERKATTFSDFIACAEALLARGLTTPAQLAIEGGSAGGLLMGAISNMAPDAYRVILTQVPFVDVVTTMLDPSIPLTTNEYDEWGNPDKREAYDYMLSYSPYDNLSKQAYPAMFVGTGLWDSQVQYWEPAKYVAKLRDLDTGTHPVVFRTNMDAGHGGKSGRFRRYRELAEMYAFMLDQLGVDRH